MADLKSQHFVPKCYLRNFSSNSTRRSINLYNIKSDKIITNASIKNQCARSYFYGKDLTIERALQHMEGKYAEVSKEAIISKYIDAGTADFLKDFTFLQYLRTEIAIRRQEQAVKELEEIVYESYPDQKPKDDFDYVQSAIEAFFHGQKFMEDLKCSVLINCTKYPLLTSDDPSINFNKFYSQKMKYNMGFGLVSAGYCMYMPISSEIGIIFFDGNVYTMPRKISIKKNSDVDIFNSYICMKAHNNIYFQDITSSEYVRQVYETSKNERTKDWHKLHYAVKDSENGPHTTYRVVNSSKERAESEESIIQIEQMAIQPKRWPSFLVYRNKPRFLDTKTAAGAVRSRPWKLHQ